MLVESKKKAKRLNSLSRINSTSASQTNGNAKIVINTETAITKLQNLAKNYNGIMNPYGFLTDLRNALGIPDSASASKYGVVNIPKEDGSTLQVSLRITNHNANANTYIRHDANYTFNLSIVVSKRFRKNKFKPNNNVKLDEYVYYGEKLLQVENPFVQIINSIIGYLQNGQYKDTTGVAYLNQSPQQANNTDNNQDIKENRNMNKKQVIRINENQLRKIVTESVKKVLKEYEDSDLDAINKQFKHVEIYANPVSTTYQVRNLTFPSIPPYVGTLKQCYKAALSAEEKSERKLNELIQKAREDGYSEDEIQKAVKERLKR